MTRTTCIKCGRVLYRTPSGNGWTDRADGTDTLGSGEICPVVAKQGESMLHRADEPQPDP